jgi:hypothetical protein
MTQPPEAPLKPPSWPITVGAEAIAAAQFARCGFDVLVQAGSDKPWYDLVVTKSGNLLRVAVRASENGRWGLTESYLRHAADIIGRRGDRKSAIDLWLDHHGSRTVCCLVQFEGIAIQQLPRIYLASPAEVAQRMHDTAARVGQPTLFEQYEWTSSRDGVTTVERLPQNWLFSHERIHELLDREARGTLPAPPVPQQLSPRTIWTTSSAA